MSTDGQPTAGGQAGSGDGAGQTPDHEGAFKHRLARELKKRGPEYVEQGRKALAEEIGIDLSDLDAFKERIAKLPDLVSAEEKARRALERANAERDQHKMRADTAEAKLSRHVIDGEVRRELQRIGVIDKAMTQVPDLIRSRLSFVDDKVVVLDDDGEPSKTALGKFLEDYVKVNDHFLTASTQRGGGDSRPPKSGDPKPHKMSREEHKAAFNAALRGS